MRIALSFLYWISIGPAVFFLLFDLLVLPAKWAVDSTWPAEPPRAAWVGLHVYALMVIVVATRAAWLLWKRLRFILTVDSARTSQTWLDRLSPSLRFPLALCLVVAGAAIVLLSVGNYLPLADWRNDMILFGALVQGAGLIGVVLALRSPSEGRRSTGGYS